MIETFRQGSSNRMRMFPMPALLFLIPIIINGALANLPPTFTLDMDNLALSESTPINSIVYTLEGLDPENGPVRYGLQGSDLFNVDRITGNVTLVRPLDREVNDTLNFNVTIEDEVKDAPLGGNNIVQVPITVIVYDENDNAPMFQNLPYDIVVKEDALIGTRIFSHIALADPDSVGQTLEVECVNLPGYENACDIFQLQTDASSQNDFLGGFLLAKPLNYSKQDSYELLLRATDGDLANTSKVLISVEDVQNTPPVFNGDLSAQVFEDAQINSLLMTLHAEDGDRQHPREIVYELVTNPMDYFLLDPKTGQVRTAQPLDREAVVETNGTLKLTVKAIELINGRKGTEPNTMTTVEVTITIKDVNDEPPMFNKRDYSVEIPENIAEGSALPNLDMNVTDPDVGRNGEFSLSLEDIANAFAIEPKTVMGSSLVTIRVNNSSLDYENLNQRKFLLLVVAKELHTDEQLSSTATVTITVTDANDNAPTFDQESYAASVSEVASPGTLVTTIVAKDRDSGKFGENGIIYSLWGSGAQKFVVNDRTGAITIAACAHPGEADCLDYEDTSEYLLSYRASDDDGKGRTSMVPLRITLTDYNDNPPMFSQSTYKVFVDEGATRFDPELIIAATDKDKTAQLTYSLIAGNEEKLFYIDPNTGRIRIASNRGLDLSNDTTSDLLLTVEASDGKFTASAKLEINVRDINNNAPIFDKDNYMVSVKEDADVGSELLMVRASDADTGVNAEVSYRIQKGAFEDFRIEPRSGVLTINRKLDYDRRNIYHIDVVAEDHGTPTLSAYATLTVTVINTNDKSPFFVPTTQKASVLEDAPVGTLVHTLIAFDPDVNASEALHFAASDPISALDKHGRQVLHRDDFREFFSVDRDTGHVVVAQPLDRDIAAVVRIPVLVTDITAATIQQGDGLLIITVTDVNDSPPVFAPPWTVERPIYHLELKEEQPVGTIVATYVAFDEDSEIAGYVIQPESDYFQINNGTGIVQIKRKIDFEVTEALNFSIIAYDTGAPQLNATANVLVSVINVNDNDPIFANASYNISVSENLPKGAHVLTIRATDNDAGVYGDLTYGLIGHNSQHFRIHPKSGEISVENADFLDREVVRETSIQVVASDNAPANLKRSASVPVHINVLDVNDNAPVFNQSIYNITVMENVQMNPPVPLLAVNATDADEGSNALIKFNIIGGNDKDVFLLGEDTGILYAHKSLIDGPRKYQLVIEARDGYGSDALADRAIININVHNVNEFKPSFIMPEKNATVEITETDAVADFLVMTVKATDKDIGENGRITYHLKVDGSNVQETTHFKIDSASGELKARNTLDRSDQAQYELVLVARDHGMPMWYESVCYLTILLVDMNDNRPEFPDSKTTNPYTFYVSENEERGQLIGQVKALDKNEGQPTGVYYYFLSGNEKHFFSLDKTDGSIFTNASFDREYQSEYNLYVLANNDPHFYLTDEDRNNLTEEEIAHDSSIAKVKVLIRDLNDNLPRFDKEIYYAAVNAMAATNNFIVNATAMDPDYGANGSISYYIKASNMYKFGSDLSSGSIIPSPFNISQSGQLNTATYLAENNQNRFIVDVAARENAAPERETVARVHIWVFEPNQLNRIILSRPVDEVLREQDEIIAELSNATQSRVIVDEIRYHTDDSGKKNEDWSDMYILVVDPQTNSIIPVTEVLKTIDSKYDFLKDYYAGFAIENVVPAFATHREDSFNLALAALIALLVVLVVGVATFIVVCCCLRHWAIAPNLKKKDALIKKAIIDDLNTTENPLWIEQKLKIYEEQELTMQVFNEPEQQFNRRNSEEFLPNDNTYATIQHPNRRGSLHMPTLSMADEFPDYATLSGYYEAAMGFQGSTFQVPDNGSNSTEDFNTFNHSRFKKSGSNDGATEFVAEII